MYTERSEVTLINRQRYMAELSKLLTFMYKEDRAEIIQHYNELLDNAEDEQAMLESFGSPTKLAVTISRTYQRDERKLSVRADSKSGEQEAAPVPKPPVRSAAKAPEDPPAQSYAEIIEEIRREKAAEQGIEYTPIFFDEPKAQEPEPEPEQQPEPEAEQVPETAPEAEQPETEQEAAEAEETPEQPETDAQVDEPEAASEGEAAEAEAEAEKAPEAEEEASEAEPESEEETEAAPEDELAENAEAPEDEQSEVDPEAAEEASDEVEAEEDEEEAEAEEADEDSDDETEEDQTEDEPEEEPEEPAKLVTVRRTSVPLLILYLLFAVPIGLVLYSLLIVIDLCLLAIAIGIAGAAVHTLGFSFSSMAVFADSILVFGAGLAEAALALVLLWFAIWLSIKDIGALSRGIVALGKKICVREVEVNE